MRPHSQALGGHGFSGDTIQPRAGHLQRWLERAVSVSGADCLARKGSRNRAVGVCAQLSEAVGQGAEKRSLKGREAEGFLSLFLDGHTQGEFMGWRKPVERAKVGRDTDGARPGAGGGHGVQLKAEELTREEEPLLLWMETAAQGGPAIRLRSRWRPIGWAFALHCGSRFFVVLIFKGNHENTRRPSGSSKALQLGGLFPKL